MIVAVLVLSVLCLAYANGTNDNFKGVATLFGSGTLNFRGALVWATCTTLLGSLAAVFLAGSLLKNFSGKGLVEDTLVANADYSAAVALGAGLTVLLASRVGMPISTTHGLVGALVGAAFAAGSAISFSKLGGSFFLALLVSPPLAVALTASFYPIFRLGRRRLGITAETCLCVGHDVIEVMPVGNDSVAFRRAERLRLEIGNAVTCKQRYRGRVLGIDAAAVLDRLHYLSAGMVGFARGLNDTPKIAALLLVAPALGRFSGVAFVGIAIAVGGMLGARRVAETMSHGITSMNHGQGFTGNLMTSVIVIGASNLGMPVSTTHVSCGALFGIGAVTGRARWGMVGKILAAWITTLPMGALLGALSFQFIQWL